jgi:hypothetical protein
MYVQHASSPDHRTPGVAAAGRSFRSFFRSDMLVPCGSGKVTQSLVNSLCHAAM